MGQVSLWQVVSSRFHAVRVSQLSKQLSSAAFIAIALFSTPALGMVHAAAFDSEHTRGIADGDELAQLHCLALNVYHEARGEPTEGKLAVAVVTLNRVAYRRFPNTVCRVVWQRAQFSWTKDGRPDSPYSAKAWKEALKIATAVYLLNQSSSVVGKAMFFHTINVRPNWAKSKRKVAQVGSHIFYETKI